MSFLETPRCPDDLSQGSAGGPGYSSDGVESSSGLEKRNVNWEYPRHEYDVAYGVKTITQLESLLAFFHVARGRAYGFRYKDFADFKSCGVKSTVSNTDQTLGTGNGSQTEFQLKKVYTKGSVQRERLIKKPVSGTVVVALDGEGQESGWSVDTVTGVITFDSPPGSGVVVTAGYEFDVPVRFDTDVLSVNLSHYQAGQARVPLVEIKQ